MVFIGYFYSVVNQEIAKSAKTPYLDKQKKRQIQVFEVYGL